jgi:hypothetical protein
VRDRQWGVLFSHASDQVTPGLVGEPHETLLAAVDEGIRVGQASGVRFVVMLREDDGQGWRSRDGIDPRAKLEEGIASGFHGNGWR